jgi:hypothetical protein
MVKILGVGRKRGKQRLSPTARSAEEIRTQHPMFQYALNEYAQTTSVGTQNDDGHIYEGSTSSWTGYDEQLEIPPAPSGLPGSRSTASNDPMYPQQHQQQQQQHQQQQQQQQLQHQQHHQFQHQHQHQHPPPPPPQSIKASDRDSTNSVHASASDTNYSSNHATNMNTQQNSSVRSHFEAEMPDASYEEYYGDAYTGQPMKYIYPSGYQSMRPRSCPWKLSIIVCLCFTWLSIFIVGHCSDRVDQTQYRNGEIDDDTLVMDIRWCGSRPLYLMWVCSMLITGISAAYCSVIGYIKVRDFAVANSRSQPPGVVDSKSDFYVQIQDGIPPAPSEDGGSSSSTTADYYRKTIYQSDGTPQFWGAHIYKPTQAAVAITSR